MRPATFVSLQLGCPSVTSTTKLSRVLSFSIPFWITTSSVVAVGVLLGTGLFARSFQMARQINPGFDPRNVLVSRLELSAAGYSGRVIIQDSFVRNLGTFSTPGITVATGNSRP